MDYKDYLAGQPMTHCWLRGKKELIAVFLDKIAKSGQKRKLRILNVGAGSGYDLETLKRYGDVYVIDINKDVLKLIPKNLYFEKKVGDACKIPYKSNFFDIVVSFDVIEHIEDDVAAVSEIRRVLKKDGHFVFSVPAFQPLFSSHDSVLGHKRRYSKKSLSRLLHKFRHLKLNYWNVIFFPPLALLRILKKNSGKADYAKFPKWLHSFFYAGFAVENMLIKHNVKMPAGLSLVGHCKK